MASSNLWKEEECDSDKELFRHVQPRARCLDSSDSDSSDSDTSPAKARTYTISDIHSRRAELVARGIDVNLPSYVLVGLLREIDQGADWIADFNVVDQNTAVKRENISSVDKEVPREGVALDEDRECAKVSDVEGDDSDSDDSADSLFRHVQTKYLDESSSDADSVDCNETRKYRISDVDARKEELVAKGVDLKLPSYELMRILKSIDADPDWQPDDSLKHIERDIVAQKEVTKKDPAPCRVEEDIVGKDVEVVSDEERRYVKVRTVRNRVHITNVVYKNPLPAVQKKEKYPMDLSKYDGYCVSSDEDY